MDMVWQKEWKVGANTMASFTIYNAIYTKEVVRPEVIKQTPKGFKLIQRNGAYELYKTHGVFNKLIDVRVGGKSRQIICLYHAPAKQNPPYTEAQVAEAYNTGQYQFHYNFIYCVKHKDDIEYEQLKWGVVKDEYNRSNPTRQAFSVCFDLSRYKDRDKVMLFKQKIARWGRREFILDDGIATKQVGDPLTDYGFMTDWAKPDRNAMRLKDFCSKNISEYPTNPFADGHKDERVPHIINGETLYIKEELKERFKQKAIERFHFKRMIAEVVFHPARVEKMLNTYGQDWIDALA